MKSKYIASLAAFLIVAISVTSPAAAATKLGQRVLDSKGVYNDLMNATDRGVPEALVKGAKAVIVIPNVLKGAIGYGARHGQGVMSTRDKNGNWGPPAFVSITGASFGLQIGAESTDLVLFFMNENGARSLINSSRITLGGKASVAAGPLGRSGEAGTDLKLNAEIYSYAKSKGLFAGVSLEGARIAPNKDAITEYYGKKISAKQVLFEHKVPRVPAEARDFMNTLQKGIPS